MKKLLIAMTAAAIGTCAWAEGETPTLLNETFGNEWTLKAPWTYWSGAETATPADGELTPGDALKLNTGSKVLRGDFMSDGSSKDIDTGLYFNATVTFQDPSDTLPVLGSQDKFALVVLDNIDSIGENSDVANTTNLWVIAQYGLTSGTKRAYKLVVPTAIDEEGNFTSSIIDLTADWLSSSKQIEVRAIKNVMASTEAARAGFLVAVGGLVCKVYASYAIEDGVIDFTSEMKYGMQSDDLYLGVDVNKIASNVQDRYTNDQLILSLVDNVGTLASVDFQGQGYIDNVALKESATADFGPDALVLNVEKTDGIEFAQGTSALMTYSKGGSVTIKFTVAANYELSSPAIGDEGLTLENDVYTYVVTPTANNQTVKISAFLPVVTILTKDGEGNDVITKYGSLAEALNAATSGAELTMTGDIALTAPITITKDVTINLNGKKLSSTVIAGMFILNGAELTIVDSGNGVLEVKDVEYGYVAKTSTMGGLKISGGTIDAIVAKQGIVCTLDGGKFLKACNDTITAATGFTATLDANQTYWVVAPVSNDPYADAKNEFVNGEITENEKEAVDATFDAIADAVEGSGDAASKVDTYLTTVYGEGKVGVNTLVNAQAVDISVKFNLPLMTSEPTVEVVAEAAEEGDAATFSFQIKANATPVEVKEAITAARKMVWYGQELDEMGQLTDAVTDVQCEVDETNNKIKVKMRKGKTKGFMKVKLR